MTVTDALIVRVEYDHLRHPTYHFTFPPGPFIISTWSFTEDDMHRAGIIMRGQHITIDGRKFLTVESDNTFQMPALICYPVSDPWTYVRLAQYRVSRYFLPLKRWIAWQFYLAGWLRQGDAFSLSRLFRRLLDETISGPADAKIAKAAQPAPPPPLVRVTPEEVRALEEARPFQVEVTNLQSIAREFVMMGAVYHDPPRTDAPISGTDDGRVAVEMPFDPALPIDESRWAEYNRKFNALLKSPP